MNIALLLAAGESKRFGCDKLFVLLKSKPVIYHSLKLFEESLYVDEIFIAANTTNKKKIEQLIKKERFKKVKKVLLGGTTRFSSVEKLILHLSFLIPHFFIIHNAANPLTTREELGRCVKFLEKNKKVSGVAVGRLVKSTIKEVLPKYDANFIAGTLPRRNLWEAETPQVVRAKDFLKAFKKSNAAFTDDLSVLEATGFKTAVIPASPHNRKITTPEDLEILKVFAGDLPKEFSVGIGQDSHRFMSLRDRRNVGRSNLVLGGVNIKNLPALEAKSDGDVVLHALCNAIASAIGKGSLGTYATKMCKRGIRDSSLYLKKILAKMERKHRKIIQCSISIEAAKPRIDPIAPVMKKKLSALLQIPEEKIGITAISGEGLTAFGKGEGVRCQASVVLSK